MRTFASEQKPRQSAKCSSSMGLARVIPRQARDVSSLFSQELIPKEFNASATRVTVVGHDFSRIPVHANAIASIQLKAKTPNYEFEQPEWLQKQINALNTQGFSQNDSAGAENITSMPYPLQAQMEVLSGFDLSGIRVHRNSARPDQLNALAYTQGQDIHLGRGQDAQLPHEAWHVVQQKQGRVRSTMQAGGVEINDNAGLEREADQMASRVESSNSFGNPCVTPVSHGNSQGSGVAQRKVQITGLDDAKRNNFLSKINEGSALKFELDGSGFLQQKDKTKVSTEVYSKEMAVAIADAQTVILNLIAKNDANFIDSFASGNVDYDDMKSLPFNMFRIWLLHFVVERFAVANYEANKATATKADFAKAHKKGHEAQERQMKQWFPKKTIKYKSEGFDAASKVVGASGNGSIDYVFNFTDVKHVFKQPIVSGATKESIISSKIIVIR